MSIDAQLAAILGPMVEEAVNKALANKAESPAPPYLTAEDAAYLASVEPATIRAWVRAGTIKGCWAGRLLRIKREDLEAYLERDVDSEGVDMAKKLRHLEAKYTRRKK